ncbi:MAG: leucine-rich repeat domain-containing protein [Bacilli bacterium]|nr:leucine-rich repeat domain-containing protein [Bacilli bacterium]
MKPKTTLFLLAPMILASLSACSGGEGSKSGNPDDYVTVNFYSDYVGIDYANLDVSKATYLGKCYLLKSDEKDVRASLLNVEKDSDGKAINYKASARTPEEGHKYTFKGWAGFYDDGTAIDSDSISHEIASCNLFADFDYVLQNYNVKVTIQGKTENFTVEYGTKFSAVYPTYASAEYQGAPYYKNFALDGYTVELNDVETLYTLEQVKDVAVAGDMTFTAHFAESTNQYTVTVKDSSANVLATEKVTYDEALTFVPTAPTGYEFSKFEGTYASDDAVPSLLRGKDVDAKHIRYDCTLTAVFVKQKITVTFRNEDDSDYVRNSSSEPIIYEIAVGSSIDAPGYTASATGFVFTGDWYTSLSDTSLAPFDFSSISESVTLYPKVVAKELSYVNGTETFFYRYDHTYKGYGLYDIATTLDSIDLEADDFFASATFADPRYPFVSILDFDEDNDRANRKINSIVLPTSTKAIYADSMMELNIASLDLNACTSLTEIQFHAFRNCESMTTLRLPSSLQTVGARIAEGNDALTSFKLEMTEAQKDARAFDEKWDYVSEAWNAAHSVTFAS